jgi:hypothetical protein
LDILDLDFSAANIQHFFDFKNKNSKKSYPPIKNWFLRFLGAIESTSSDN